MRFEDVRWFESMGHGKWLVTTKIQDRYSSDWDLNPIDCRFETVEEAEAFRREVMEHRWEVLDKVYEVGEYSDDDMVWVQVFLVDEDVPDTDNEAYYESYEVIP